MRLHVSFPDPSGSPLTTWREVRDAIGKRCKTLIETLVSGKTSLEADLQAVSIRDRAMTFKYQFLRSNHV